jgi:histone-binding protein RBBP4
MKQPIHSILAHSSDIYSLDFNPFNEYLLLTGSADKTVALWDLRNTGKRLYSFEGHSDEVVKV